jgi:hypothetical protein
MNSDCRLADNLAFARCLQQPQTVAYGLLRLLVALPLVVELQPRPLIRIHGLEVDPPELAVGRRLRYEQRPVGPANPDLRVSLHGGGGGGSGGRCGGLDGICLNFSLSRILGATGSRHRARQGGERQKLTCRLRRSKFEETVGTGRSSRGRHGHGSNSIEAGCATSPVPHSSQRELRAAAAPGFPPKRGNHGLKI